jgi:hypothetical protein
MSAHSSGSAVSSSSPVSSAQFLLGRAAKLACVALVASAGATAFAAQQPAEPLVEGRAPASQTAVTGQSEAEEAAPKPLMALLDKTPIGNGLRDAGIEVGGLAEAGYTYSTSSPPDNVITGRAFDFENQDPTLNQVMLYAERTTDASKPWDLGFRIEALYGADARFTHSNGLLEEFSDGENQFDLTQIYGEVVIPVGHGIKTKVGKFITPLGYELVNPSGNAFYSHSFLFGIVPFAHTGVLGTYQVGDNLSVSFGFSRGWDQALEDNNDDALDAIGVVAYTLDDKTNLTFSFTTGPEQAGNSGRYRTALDFIATHQVNDKLTLAVNADYIFDARAGQDGDDSQVYGVAGYLGYKLCPCATLNTRLEWFNDTSRIGGFDAVLYEATVGVALTPFKDGWASNLVIRPEARWDYADNDVFDGGTDDQQLTFGVDAYITF